MTDKIIRAGGYWVAIDYSSPEGADITSGLICRWCETTKTHEVLSTLDSYGVAVLEALSLELYQAHSEMVEKSKRVLIKADNSLDAILNESVEALRSSEEKNQRLQIIVETLREKLAKSIDLSPAELDDETLDCSSTIKAVRDAGFSVTFRVPEHRSNQDITAEFRNMERR